MWLINFIVEAIKAGIALAKAHWIAMLIVILGLIGLIVWFIKRFR